MNKTIITNQLLKQLQSIIEQYNQVKAQTRHGDLSDIEYTKLFSIMTSSRAAVERITGTQSAYSNQIYSILELKNVFEGNKMEMVVGVVESLKTDLEEGYISTVKELIHGEIFADYLEMANSLSNDGYKDAAAVIASSTLEEHLRQLCLKNSIDIEINTSKGMRPKKADKMNSDLTSASIYSKLDQKNVTAWLDLRNKAAHGNYSEYTKEQVALLVAGIRDFITRIPA